MNASPMPDLAPEYNYFASVDGDRLAYFIERPAAEPRAVVTVLHGYSEYSGRYLHVVQRLLDEGYAVAAMDHRGHGHSEGRRAFIPSFAAPATDVNTFLGMVAAEFPGKKHFVFAHSMGAALAVECVLNHQPPLDGLMLSGAGLKINYQVNPFLRAVSRLGSVLLPRWGLVPLQEGLTTHDAAMQANANADPLIYRGGIPLRTGELLLQAWGYFAPRLQTITLPLLLLHGTADQLADPAASQGLYERAASTDKTLKLYDGLMHEVVNEVERETVLQDMVDWLAARV